MKGCDRDGDGFLLNKSDWSEEVMYEMAKMDGIEITDEIKKYYSMIGNSDVPYPVAIGEKNVYFLIESTYLSKDYFYDFPKKY